MVKFIEDRDGELFNLAAVNKVKKDSRKSDVIWFLYSIDGWMEVRMSMTELKNKLSGVIL